MTVDIWARREKKVTPWPMLQETANLDVVPLRTDVLTIRLIDPHSHCFACKFANVSPGFFSYVSDRFCIDSTFCLWESEPGGSSEHSATDHRTGSCLLPLHCS